MSYLEKRDVAAGPRGYVSELRGGVVAMAPLWLGVAPFGIAFALLARTAGFDVLTTQACSALIFAGAAQVALVTLVASGAGPVAIVLTTVMLNLRHVLYALSLGPKLAARPRPPRPLLAFLLTDEAYGVTVKALLEGRGSDAFFLGAGLSLYAVFNLSTLAGSLLGQLLRWRHLNPAALGLDFIFPLTFLALLLPLLRTRRHVLVAVLSGLTALVLSHYVPAGVTILAAAVVAAVGGAALDGNANVDG